MNLIARNPNAAVSAATFTLGELIVWIAGYFHVSLTAAQGAGIGGVLTFVALFVGKRGINGIFRLVWRGNTAA